MEAFTTTVVGSMPKAPDELEQFSIKRFRMIENCSRGGKSPQNGENPFG